MFEDFGEISSECLQCRVFFARKKGRSHTEKGTVCQDYCLVGNINDSFVLLAVADGHGGETYTKSDTGSRKACEVLFDLVSFVSARLHGNDEIERKLPALINSREFKEKYILQWKSSVIKDFREHEGDTNLEESEIIHKYGTTVLFVIATKKNYILGQLGDGAILMFNPGAMSQIFCRRPPKTSSTTNSLIASNAVYAFVTETFPRNMFSRILISTDGIYDRLSRGNSFLRYGVELSERAEIYGCLKYPFTLNDTDVSEIASDDCTVGLLISSIPEKDSHLLSGYFGENLSFRRSLEGIGIYRTETEGHTYEIHIVDGLEYVNDNGNVKFHSVEIIRPVEELETVGGSVLIYEIPKDVISIRELIERGWHLEKRYNPTRSDDDDDDNNDNIYTNIFWLKVYERLLAFDSELLGSSFGLNSFYPDVMFVNEDKIFLASDAVVKNFSEVRFSPLKKCLDYFNIIGKLCADEFEVPLFTCSYQGQTVSINEEKLCRVVYMEKKKIYGLWNLSGASWHIEGTDAKDILPGKVLRLNVSSVSFTAEGRRYNAMLFAETQNGRNVS